MQWSDKFIFLARSIMSPVLITWEGVTEITLFQVFVHILTSRFETQMISLLKFANIFEFILMKQCR